MSSDHHSEDGDKWVIQIFKVILTLIAFSLFTHYTIQPKGHAPSASGHGAPVEHGQPAAAGHH